MFTISLTKCFGFLREVECKTSLIAGQQIECSLIELIHRIHQAAICRTSELIKTTQQTQSIVQPSRDFRQWHDIGNFEIGCGRISWNSERHIRWAEIRRSECENVDAFAASVS